MNVVTSRAEDQAFIDGLRKGEFGSLEKIYQTFFPPIFGFIKNHGGNQEDAKDTFQEGIMVMYRMANSPDFTLNSSFLSLLFPICRNTWFKSVRKRPFYDSVDEGDERYVALEGNIEKIMQEREMDGLFKKKFNLLGDQCQSLLQLFFEGASMKEIVQTLGLSSISFAKKKKFQCKEKLVKMVQADPLFPELKY